MGACISLYMTLLTLVVVLIVIGMMLWLANSHIPMDGKIRSILNIAVVVAVVLWLLSVFGLWDAAQGIRVGPR